MVRREGEGYWLVGGWIAGKDRGRVERLGLGWSFALI